MVFWKNFYPWLAGIYLKTMSSLSQGCNTGCFKNIKISSAYARSKQIPIGIWGISQMPGYLENFPNAYCYLRVVYFLDFGFSNEWKFPRYPGIWGIPQTPRHLRNSPKTQTSWISQMPRFFWKFPKYPVI